ncbi:hypothetical protein HZB02_04880 [Candidatus Woesearchaeota archaeon]|nr:hypothetical protein [Candidatus Woesearchaeota archaeon]
MTDAPVEEVIIEDDGTGFDFHRLKYLESTKSPLDPSIGQFGEGTKLAATGALRKHLLMQYYSQDWCATPSITENHEKLRKWEHSVLIEEDQTIPTLTFNVETDLPVISGSKTVFSAPNDELVKIVQNIGSYMLYFNKDYEVLFESRSDRNSPSPTAGDRMLDIKQGGKTAFFVKGVVVSGIQKPSIFSYDLQTDKINPDRNFADDREVQKKVSALVSNCTHEGTIETILQKAETIGYAGKTDLVEMVHLESYAWTDPVKTAWRNVFQRLYTDCSSGQPVVLADGTQSDKDASFLGYRVLSLE